MLRMNVHRSAAFVFAVVPFDQVPIDFGRGPEASQFAGASGALQRTREDLRKGQSRQPFPKPAGIAFATLGERYISQPCMLAREAPGGLAVPCQINHWKNFAHVRTTSPQPSPPAEREKSVNQRRQLV